MQNDPSSDSAVFQVYETEKLAGISGSDKMPAVVSAVSTGENDRDTVTISDEAMMLAEMIIPYSEDNPEYYDSFNMAIATQGGLVGPGGAMVNIASSEEPVYAVVLNGIMSISGTEITPPQGMSGVRQSTIKMLEYVQMLMQNVRFEESHDLQNQLLNMVASLANVQEELSGDPNFKQDTDSLQEAFRTITSILIADSARVKHQYMPDSEQIILDARDMADMFNNLFFENFIELGAREAFSNAWSVLSSNF